MKKKVSLLLAALLAISVFAGCKQTDDNIDGIPEPEVNIITPMTTTEAPPETTTTTKATTTTASESETEETTEETTTEPSASQSSDESVVIPILRWSETETSGVFYTTQACYSRKEAIVGSETVQRYEKGARVNVTAVTDTGYYKLEDGSFIHSSYLTDEDPAVTTTSAARETTRGTTGTTEATVSVNPNISSSYHIDHKTRYGYKSLNDAQKKLYDNILASAVSFQQEVALPGSITNDDIFKVYGMVYNQEPQLFWLKSTVPMSLGGMLYLDFLVSDISRVQQMQNEIDAKTKEILQKASAYPDAHRKVKVFYDSVILNNDFAKAGDGWSSTVYNGFTGKGGLQCSGYAKSFMYLCDLAGINCMFITGEKDDELTHAWNKVNVNGSWYNIDLTWGDPDNDYDSRFIRYNWFLVPDSWIKNTHLYPSQFRRTNGTVVTYFTPPSADKSDLNYFRSNNMEYSTYSAAEKALYAQFDEAFKSKKNIVHIRVTDKAIFDKLLSNEAALAFQNYAKEKGGASKLARQTSYNGDIMVVQYNIMY